MGLLDMACARRLLRGAVSNTLELEYGYGGRSARDKERQFLAKVTANVWNGLLCSMKATDGEATCRRPERMVAELVRRGVLPAAYRMNGLSGILSLPGGRYSVDKKLTGFTVDPCPRPFYSHLPACITMDEREFAGFLLEFDAFRQEIASSVHEQIFRQEAVRKSREIMAVTLGALERELLAPARIVLLQKRVERDGTLTVRGKFPSGRGLILSGSPDSVMDTLEGLVNGKRDA